MSIYMRVQGIEGNVTAKGHEKWIELNSLDFAASRNIQTRTGKTSDREATLPTVGEVVVSLDMNKASPNLFSEACVGKAKTVKIDVCQTGTENAKPYLEYTLNNVLFSSYEVRINNNDSHGAPEEVLTLNFDKIEMKYIPFDEKNNPQSPIPTGYDLTTGTKV